jgi:hypothetical protein
VKHVGGEKKTEKLRKQKENNRKNQIAKKTIKIMKKSTSLVL